MQFKIDHRSALPLYAQLKQQIQLGILSGHLRPGETLPPIRTLAARLTINPNTMARVYRELEAEGYLETRQGKGSFVAAIPPAEGSKRRRAVAREEARLLLEKMKTLGIGVDEAIRLIKEVQNVGNGD